MTITDRDREAYTADDSHEATALLSALRNMHCDRPHPIFGPPCERCLSTVHDALAKAICVIRNTAIEKGRALAMLSCMDNPDHSPNSLAFKLREQGREEGRAELDAERAAHEVTKKRLRVDDWSATEPYRQEIDALKVRLALAEAVESALGAFLNRAEFFRGRSEWRETLAKADNALAAWRAAK